ncbi:MAG TPA: kelch repeat-containing protein, partial [Candidatus Acidoferrum sp.]|nr:kelch repeat-containing protein [Candidatus Acidoferrum sp.]
MSSVRHRTATRSGISVRIVVGMVALAFNLSARPAAQAGVWVTNGPMVTARYNHTATLLPNGKVLVAGGWNGSYLASAELYDPATGSWTHTGTMATNRCYHTATLLPNGKVLVVGGYGNNSPYYLSSAETYDPATGTWTATGPMISAHVYHTATLLRNGKVLVAGGVNNLGGYNRSELFDPATGTWQASGTMQRSRWYHTATLLTNGMVLVAGGDYANLPSAELYNPVTETWTSTSLMTTYRESAAASLLPNGQVLVAGGWQTVQVQTNPPAYTSVSLASGEIYDPTAGTWTVTTNTMTTGRNWQTASLLPNGQVLQVAGFQNGPGQLAGMELFDSASGAWLPTTNRLHVARWGHTATMLPGGRIVVAGGISVYGVTNSTEVYDSTNATWTTNGGMNNGRAFHTATLLPNNEVLVVGGEASSFPPSLSSVELYDLVSGTWTATNSLITARYGHTATLLPNGKVLIAGGYTGNGTSGYLSSAELYDPVTGTWMATGSLNTARISPTATLLSNGKALLAGGNNSTSGNLSSAELYDPATGTWAATGPLTTARYGHTATLLPNGKVLVAGGYTGNGTNGFLSGAELYDPVTGMWMATNPLITARYGHTATLLPNGKVLVVGGATNYIGGLSYFVTASSELYDPVTGTWTTTGPLTTARSAHKATLLPSGKVLVAGGWNTSPMSSISSAEIYDPATETWIATSSLTTARFGNTVTLLPNGKALVAGGLGSPFPHYFSSAELYDTGLGCTNSWQPQIAAVTSPFNLGSSLVIAGAQFRGIAEGSSGSTQDSSTDYPLVQLHRLDNDQTLFLLATNWSTNSFASVPVWNFPAGPALVTVFVNGIQSTSAIVNISVPVPTAPVLTGVQKPG